MSFNGMAIFDKLAEKENNKTYNRSNITKFKHFNGKVKKISYINSFNTTTRAV